MAEVAIIAPTALLEKYCNTGIQYILPRLLIEDKTYRDFYLNRSIAKDMIILDCRKPFGIREPEDLATCCSAASLLDIDLVILPSYAYRQKQTHLIEPLYKDIGDLLKIKCIEGASLEELYLNKVAGTIVALPAHMYRILTKTKNTTIYIDNHSSIEEIKPTSKDIVITSLPVRLGLQGRLISDTIPGPPPLDFNIIEDNYPEVIEANIEETLRLYGGR